MYVYVYVYNVCVLYVLLYCTFCYILYVLCILPCTTCMYVSVGCGGGVEVSHRALYCALWSSGEGREPLHCRSEGMGERVTSEVVGGWRESV